MNGQPNVEFQWLSPLGISVLLFLLSGSLYVLIGALAPLLEDKVGSQRLLIVSPRTDAIVFGQNPTDLLRDDRAVAQLRHIVYLIMAGLFVAAGLLEVSIAWFGLRQGEVWSLAVLAICGLALLPYWLAALQPYFRPGVNLTLGDTPPFMWVPATLLLPAIFLGWIGLGYRETPCNSN